MAHTNGKQEAQKSEGIFQLEEAWVTIEQKDMIAHPFMLGQLLHHAASHCIIQDWRSMMFHPDKLGHLEFWEQYVEAVNHALLLRITICLIFVSDVQECSEYV